MAKGHENIVGKGFDKRPENINRTGANRRLISTVNDELEAKGVTAATKGQITDCYLKLINLTMPDLQKIANDNAEPALVRIVAKAILSGKGFEVIEKMLDRTIQKAVQPVEVQGGGLHHVISFEDFGAG